MSQADSPPAPAGCRAGRATRNACGGRLRVGGGLQTADTFGSRERKKGKIRPELIRK